jgi:hypothetical protein
VKIKIQVEAVEGKGPGIVLKRELELAGDAPTREEVIAVTRWTDVAVRRAAAEEALLKGPGGG